MTLAQDASQNTSVSYTADIMGIAAIVGMWKMLEKAGEPGWAALIPFYNILSIHYSNRGMDSRHLFHMADVQSYCTRIRKA